MQTNGMVLRWLILGLVLGLFLDVYSSSSRTYISSVFSAYELPLPADVEMQGTISNVRVSGTARVFELVNAGKITCYYRHPPPSFFPFSGDVFVVRARIEQTPRGRLCVVQEMTYRATP